MILFAINISRRFFACALAALACLSQPARATEAIVVGDSIGKGLATTIGFKSLAKISFSLRRGDVAGQLAEVPKDKIGILSVGLNDAADPVEQLSKFIERVIDAIEKSERKVIWLGPPCVLGKKWGQRAEELDQHLKKRLAEKKIEYVSLRDDKICAAPLRTRDGEHFTHDGYRYLWEHIRRQSKLAATIELDACEKMKAEWAPKGRKITDCSGAQLAEKTAPKTSKKK